MGRSLSSEHVSACGSNLGSSPGLTRSVSPRCPSRVVGKAILYAERNLVAPEIELVDSGITILSR